MRPRSPSRKILAEMTTRCPGPGASRDRSTVSRCASQLLGVIGAALAEGARRRAALMALLILPLAVPLLIFGTLASKSETGIINPHLMLLGAVLAVLLAIAPLVAACALEIGETETGV